MLETHESRVAAAWDKVTTLDSPPSAQQHLPRLHRVKADTDPGQGHVRSCDWDGRRARLLRRCHSHSMVPCSADRGEAQRYVTAFYAIQAGAA